MARNISRVQFLRGNFSGHTLVIRPPWSVEESVFTESCTRCNECLKVCETGILVAGQGGFPEVNFSKGECSFCQQCAQICREKIFNSVNKIPWQHVAIINENCLSLKGIVCQVCGEQCESRAIRFKQQAGKIAQPVIDTDNCNGCGACSQPCPVSAIEFQQIGDRDHMNQKLEAFS
ncbi:MAG: ferredoxin-type protein NapF [Gammaproteobacteria bacterium]|nr:ferredoxin-type protein NapF [Gammaproteobacteria bacterium]